MFKQTCTVSADSCPLLVYGVLGFFLLIPAASGDKDMLGGRQLDTFESRHYKVHTNVNDSEARFYAEHMDEVFEEYTDRFRSLTSEQQIRNKMSLYLFRTQEEYTRYMQNLGIRAALTGGMYFQRAGHNGLATFVRRDVRSMTQTFATLQHEGFHQFAAAHIGRDMPIWANEGIAQYFEDGIVIDGDEMRLGVADGRRIRQIKKMVQEGHVIPFSRLLSMSSRKWHKELMTDAEKSRTAYAQTWSMVFFLINADDRYRKAFVKYLKLIRQGQNSKKAFYQVFQTENLRAFRREWEKYAQNMTPGPVATTESRLNFFGRALLFIQNSDRNVAVPADMDDLKTTLQRLRFQAVFTVGRTRTTYNARNDQLFTYPDSSGNDYQFKMLEAEKENLLPRIQAPHLQPQPTLAWYRTDSGQMMYDIVWDK